MVICRQVMSGAVRLWLTRGPGRHALRRVLTVYVRGIKPVLWHADALALDLCNDPDL